MLNKFSLKFKIGFLALLIAAAMTFLGVYGFSELSGMNKYVGESIDAIDSKVSVLMDIEKVRVLPIKSCSIACVILLS